MIDFDLSIVAAQTLALLGPSGCGKSTLLRIISGLDTAYEGTVTRPSQSRIGFVFQEPRLLPWRTLEENIRIAAPQASRALIDDLFERLGLRDHRTHYPAELSLGLARRGALARALAFEPDILVLDEPFTSLDRALAVKLRQDIAKVLQSRPMTCLFVSHDIDDAIRLADRIVVLSSRPARIMGDFLIEPARQRMDDRHAASWRARIETVISEAGA